MNRSTTPSRNRFRTPLATPARALLNAAALSGLLAITPMSTQAQGAPALIVNPLDAASLQAAAAANVTAFGRSPTESALVGTWQGISPYAEDTVEQFLLTLRDDGSYTLVARMRMPADAGAGAAPADIASAGRWSASGGLFVTVATQSGDQALDLRDRALGAIYAIRELEGPTFAYQHVATGALYPTRRVAADTVLRHIAR